MAGGARPEPPRYNPILDRFVAGSQADGNVPGLIAYGLYKIAKREWAQEINARHGRRPTIEEQEAYIPSWTASRLQGLEQQANSTLAAFGAAVIEAETPAIRENALRGTAWQAITSSIYANAIYTLVLIVIAVILAWSGVDLVGLIQKARPPGG